MALEIQPMRVAQRRPSRSFTFWNGTDAMAVRIPLSILLALAIGACGRDERPTPHSVEQRADAQTGPVFEAELWPGEGIPVITAVRGEQPLLRAPSPESSSVGSLGAAAGARIDYDSTRLQTISPAKVTVTDSAVVRGRFLGAVHLLSRDSYYSANVRDTTIPLVPPEHFEYLQPRAEGRCFVRIGGSVIEANPCPTHEPARFAVSGEPALRWWIFARGDSIGGWLLVSDSTAKVVRRGF
jgi:hypothetical protein